MYRALSLNLAHYTIFILKFQYVLFAFPIMVAFFTHCIKKMPCIWLGCRLKHPAAHSAAEGQPGVSLVTVSHAVLKCLLTKTPCTADRISSPPFHSSLSALNKEYHQRSLSYDRPPFCAYSIFFKRLYQPTVTLMYGIWPPPSDPARNQYTTGNLCFGTGLNRSSNGGM